MVVYRVQILCFAIGAANILDRRIYFIGKVLNKQKSIQ
jgi:hypothetical protein